jgi:hypothetical protein
VSAPFGFRAALNLDSADLLHSNAAKTVFLLLLGIPLLLRRYLYRKHLRHMVDKDQKQVASIFRGIQKLEDDDLSRLACACEKITSDMDINPGTLKQPTQNLAQLRAQAAALQIIMDSKLMAWSESFPGLGEPECGGMDSGISTVKLFAFYDGDSARLFDYCIGGLWFGDIGRLLLCLKIIQGDSSVRIVRLKNSFLHWNQEHENHGYRYVHLLAKRIGNFRLE